MESTQSRQSVNSSSHLSISVAFAALDLYPLCCHKHSFFEIRVYGDMVSAAVKWAAKERSEFADPSSTAC
jgi:hypothetical protein